MAHGGEQSFLARTAAAFSLPEELTPGVPVVEVTGNREVRMSNHRGIVAYGREEISISGGRLFVRVQGKELNLKAMSGSELLITGIITAIHLE
jgi:sporulation protein YqfC